MAYYLYWIHLPNHKNLINEGYIGVSKNPHKRFIAHKCYKQNPHLANAFEKYKDITHTILLQGLEDYCYKIEEKLRPNPEIGWNINIGGTKPPMPKKGRKHKPQGPQPKEYVEKRTQGRSRNWSIKNPEGKVFIIRNLKKFCRENDLDQGNLARTFYGKQKTHKGWTCKKI